MDIKLREGVDQHGKNWKVIAKLLNNVVDSKHCQKRWSTVVKPKLDGCNDESPWSLDEFYKLKELVEANTNHHHHHHPTYRSPPHKHTRGKPKRKVTIDWTTISKEMNRQYQSCVNNWRQIHNQSLKQGPFTANEDAIIMNKLLEASSAENGKLPRGIWVDISRGLNRDLNSVYEHWRQILSKKNRTVIDR